MNLDKLALLGVLLVPLQYIHRVVGPSAAAIGRLAVVPEWAVENLAWSGQLQQQILGGIPRSNKRHAKGH